MFTREDVKDLWLNDYFPSTRSWMDETHPPRCPSSSTSSQGAEISRLRLTDLSDASTAALAGQPHLLLEERWRRQTSYFGAAGATTPTSRSRA